MIAAGFVLTFFFKNWMDWGWVDALGSVGTTGCLAVPL